MSWITIESRMLPINRCLNQKLSELCQKVLYLEELNFKVSQFLPETLRAHVKAASFHQGKLVLIVSGQEWATQLRYNLPELRDKLRSEGKIFNLTTIKMKIDTFCATPHSQTSQTAKASRITLPGASRSIIQAAGAQCQYQPLQDALMRLARIEEDK